MMQIQHHVKDMLTISYENKNIPYKKFYLY